MRKQSMKNALLLLLCMVLIAAMALTFTGCTDTTEEHEQFTGTFTDGDTLGKGSTTFTLVVDDGAGKEVAAQVSTDETILGKALLELGIIAGEDTEYGLYLKTVNGATYDYEKDGKYWAFYIDGEYALTGIDSTEIVAGTVYTLKAEAG